MFRGADTYVETVVRRITVLLLEEAEIKLFKDPTVSVLYLLYSLNTTESPRFTNAKSKLFDGIVVVESYLREEVKIYPQTSYRVLAPRLASIFHRPYTL